MSKTKKPTAKTRKKTEVKKKTSTNSAAKALRAKEIEEAAQLAAEEALAELEVDEYDIEEDPNKGEPVNLNFNSHDDNEEDNSEESMTPSYDIFQEAFNLAQRSGDLPKFMVKKDGQMIGSFMYPCSWETLQARYGGGYYQVQARLASNGRIIKNAVEMIAGIPDTDKPAKDEHDSFNTTQQPSMFEMLNMLNQATERAEAKSREASAGSQSQMGLLMQTMLQSQQQAQQQFQTMIMELNKQSQNQSQQSQALVTTLLTAMLSKKETSNDGFTAASVMKMVQDAESKAETRTKSWFDLVEKKAEALAEDKAQAMSSGKDEEESLTRSVIKGFIPVISQVMAQQGQAQQARQLAPQPQPQQLVPAPAQRPPAGAQAAGPVRVVQNHLPKTIQANPSGPIAVPRQNNDIGNVRKIRPEELNTEGLVQTEKTKESARKPEEISVKDKIINILQMDIAQAFMLKKSPVKTAENCIKKLETKGILRQTVINAFSLEDCYQLADQYGVLEKAKPWITEFYETLVKEKPIPKSGAAPRTQARQLT